jgi:hypothetical protein
MSSGHCLATTTHTRNATSALAVAMLRNIRSPAAGSAMPGDETDEPTSDAPGRGVELVEHEA